MKTPAMLGTKMYLITVLPCLWILSLYGGVSGQSIIEGPVNIAAKYGDSSTLHCSIDRGTDTIIWTFHPNGTTTQERLFLYDDTHVQQPNPNYEVDENGIPNGVVDLIILETSVSTAGRYTCSLLYANVHDDAQFVSLAPVTCDPAPGEREVLEGTTVMLTCDVSYIGYQPPEMTWMAEHSTTPLQGTWEHTTDRSTFIANVTAEPELDMMQFTCDLFFTTDTSEPAPVYNDTCSTHFLVQHGATSIAIIPDPDGVVNVNVGDTINCSASGRPYPEFRWEGDDLEFVMGPILTVQAEWTDMQKTFTCFAQNQIDSVVREASLPIEILVSDPEPPPVTTSGGTEPWVIAIAIIVPIVVISLTVGIVFLVLHKKKKKKKKQKNNSKSQDFSQFPDGSMPTVTMMPDPRAGGQPRPGPPRGRPPPGHNQNGMRPPGPPTQTRYQNAALIAGMSVPVTPDVDTEQNRRIGGDSPGYGDLGIKQFSSSHSGGLDTSSIDLNPGPRYGQRHGSRESLGPSRGFDGSQSSMGPPPPTHPPPPLGPPPPTPLGAPLSNHPMDMLQNQSISSQNMRNMEIRQQQMGSQHSLSNMQAARGMMGSQHSLSNMQAARGMMGSQHSMGHMQAARGVMGSRGSLASQGSRAFVNQFELSPDVPDTEV